MSNEATSECVCPFPRTDCPDCDHICGACWTGLRAQLRAARSHLETATAENERLRQELGGGDIYRHANEALQLSCDDMAAHLETARKALEAIEARLKQTGETWVDVVADMRGIALRALDTPAATPVEEPAADPYCSLAASEIPGFGTDRDKHRCAKLHRDKPAPRSPSRSSK